VTRERLEELGRKILYGRNLSNKEAAELFAYATGHGIVSPARCSRCDGSGVVRLVMSLSDQAELSCNAMCDECGGSGYKASLTWGQAEKRLKGVLDVRFA